MTVVWLFPWYFSKRFFCFTFACQTFRINISHVCITTLLGFAGKTCSYHTCVLVHKQKYNSAEHNNRNIKTCDGIP